MASPFEPRGHSSMELVPMGPTAEDSGFRDIPRWVMRVKILYTFDDENKSNCLARLPNALSIPTVALDDTTHVGIIPLKVCTQAIVAASPELVAKLGHDYTVYAYDYSEYETPLVGQGMLSWILASASATPNVPADESQTMVTGRVCRNISGLFSHGIKETLEVKLKLVPVPTCMQREYVENMERYHSLSQIIPQGLDYTAWAEFLKQNPVIEQLAHLPQQTSAGMHRYPTAGLEALQDTLSRPKRPSEDHRGNGCVDQQGTPCGTPYTTASSPVVSRPTLPPRQTSQDSSRTSPVPFQDESISHAAAPLHDRPETQDQSEEGPPKKRARVTRASRPRKSNLKANKDSLRVTASTAASVRLHKPASANPATFGIDSAELVPRAPTPRPGERTTQPRDAGRTLGPSLLRHASVDDGRSYQSPYEAVSMSDNAMDSADDERGNSPGDTPIDIPSSPPLMPQRYASPAPSSPGLPLLAAPIDSGFVSDMPVVREEEEQDRRRESKSWEGGGLATAAVSNTQQAETAQENTWHVETPGPTELLPKSYIAKPKTYPRPSKIRSITEDGLPPDSLAQERTASPSVEPSVENQLSIAHALDESQDAVIKIGYPEPFLTSVSEDDDHSGSQLPSRSATPNFTTRPAQGSRPRGLPRSQTWAGGEAMSDAVDPPETNSRQPRSGSGAVRKRYASTKILIQQRLQDALVTGNMPKYCSNCGQIDTPTWRKAYTRVELGVATRVQNRVDGSGIIAVQLMEPTEGGHPRYRIYKQVLDPEEHVLDCYQELTLCNPCGLWLSKKGCMRPPEVWVKMPPKKPRRPQKKTNAQTDDTLSDAVLPQSEPAMLQSFEAPSVPFSEPIMPESHEAPPAQVDLAVNAFSSIAADAAADMSTMPPLPPGAPSYHSSAGSGEPQTNSILAAAFQKAIQSSPPGFQDRRQSLVEHEHDLTPKPTRRVLFPSPCKTGEAKRLDDCRPLSATAIGVQPSQTSGQVACLAELGAEDTNKENCAPSLTHEDDDLAHLFEDILASKTTPTKSAALFHDLLKTPTPGSRQRRNILTPKSGVENNSTRQGPVTPSSNILTPRRSNRVASLVPETPFTRQLNELLSQSLNSPSQALDFSSFPLIDLTPGRALSGSFTDFLTDDFLSSDMPMPSSPPGLGFALYEDPATSTDGVGLWSGASIFDGGDAVVAGNLSQASVEQQDGGASKPNATVASPALVKESTGKRAESIQQVDSELPQGNTEVSATTDTVAMTEQSA